MFTCLNGAPPLQVRKQNITTKSATARKHPTPKKKYHQLKDVPVSATNAKNLARKSSSRNAPKSRSNVRVDFGVHDSDSDDTLEIPRKKVKNGSDSEADLNRQVCSQKSFSGDTNHFYPLVHAAEVPWLEKSVKFQPLFEGLSENVEVQLQYPSISQKERYLLVRPQFDEDAFDSLRDIMQVMHKVAENYLPPSKRKLFDNEISGFPRRLSRAVQKKSDEDFKRTICEWNDAIGVLLKDGTIVNILESQHSLNSGLVEQILSQAYSRTVSPRLKVLHRYEAGTDNVYGELMPKFISTILKKDLQLKSDQIFVDLGSGVGNVVLQAALEIGCESWGCEIMSDYCDVADLQQVEFRARCQLWGLSLGEIHLERGDFLTNVALTKVLQKADVILVNNQVFTPELNESLTSLFLDLKDGCRVVSLKSFVPSGHKITDRKLYALYNVLQVEEKEYFSESVSWTSAGGKYYISTKDATRVQVFESMNR